MRPVSEPIVVTILATISTVVRLESDDLGTDSVGLFLELEPGSEDTVRVLLRGKDLQSQSDITGVRSVPTPDLGQGPWTSWAMDDGVYVSPTFSLGDEIRIEVDNSAGVSSVPEGGGHFRVVEEGGGLVLASNEPSDRCGPEVPESRVPLS